MSHCQRTAVSQQRLLIEIQEGSELCLKGEQECGFYPTPSHNHDAPPGTPVFSCNLRRCRSSEGTGAGGWGNSCEVRDVQRGGVFENECWMQQQWMAQFLKQAASRSNGTPQGPTSSILSFLPPFFFQGTFPATSSLLFLDVSHC
ncbi:hypothetical protein CRENBAI_003422 [Crenichthys baileyi]|uniref:Uncharacterized protein n=1 Tax=Crenichthys baileyi TaxID=28760 RepID=A0AAV9SMT7_9TELE